MPALDSRSRNILLTLLASEKPISTALIAERMQTSPRVIGYSLQRIENWLTMKNLSVKKQPGKGISVDYSEDTKNKLKKEIENITSYDLILSKEERARLLIIALITAKESLLVKSFAPLIGVSRPTVFSDLDEVEKWLQAHELKLIRRPGYGFKVEGTELKIRNALEAIVVDSTGQISLLASIQGKMQDGGFTPNQFNLGIEQISKICGVNLDLEGCELLTEKVESLSSFKFTDSSHIAMALFFSILIERTRKGNYLEESPFPTPELLETKEYSIAQEVTGIIDRRYGFDLNQSETANIAAHIMCIKGRQSLAESSLDSNSFLSNEDIEDLLDEMIHEAAKLLHPILDVDQQLKQGLRYHIRPAINRLYFGLPIQNNLLDEIKIQYAYIYDVAKKTGKILQNRIGFEVPDTEIGYLAMHFGAALERQRSLITNRIKTIIVCGGGCSTAWMLVSRLAAEFPELDIVDIKSAKDVSSKAFRPDGIDLMITTIPLQYTSIPLIQVTPLLGVNDKLLIRQVLGTEVIKPKVKERLDNAQGPSMADLLTHETMQFGLQAKTWEDAVDISCAALLQDGSIDMFYVEGIKELIRQHGPYMVLSPGIVLLHAMTGSGVNKVCMSITTFQMPIRFGHSYNDPVSLALVIGSPDDHSHLRSLRQLSRLLEDKPLMQSLQSCLTKTDFFILMDTVVKTKIEKMDISA